MWMLGGMITLTKVMTEQFVYIYKYPEQPTHNLSYFFV